MLGSFTAPIGIEQDFFGAQSMLAKSSVRKLAVEHLSKRARQLVQSPLFVLALRSAVVINSVVGVIADSDVCPIM